MVSRVSFSMPLATVTTGTWCGRNGSAFITSRVACEGVAKTTIRSSRSASSRAVVPRMFVASGMPGRYVGFSWRSLTAEISASSRPQSITSS